MKTLISPLATAIVIVLSLAQGHSASAPLKADEPIVVPDSKGRFDFIEVDPVARRLLAGKLITTVAIPVGVDQIAIDPALRRIYCPGSGMLAVVQETDSGAEPAGEIAITKGCRSVAVDPKTHAVWLAYAEGDKSYVRRFLPDPAPKP